eukprot:2630185-Pleurochrysis_carterae.AAC.1
MAAPQSASPSARPYGRPPGHPRSGPCGRFAALSPARTLFFVAASTRLISSMFFEKRWLVVSIVYRATFF